MVLVPKERACSKLHDIYKKWIDLFDLYTLLKEKEVSSNWGSAQYSLNITKNGYFSTEQEQK